MFGGSATLAPCTVLRSRVHPADGPTQSNFQNPGYERFQRQYRMFHPLLVCLGSVHGPDRRTFEPANISTTDKTRAERSTTRPDSRSLLEALDWRFYHAPRLLQRFHRVRLAH